VKVPSTNLVNTEFRYCVLVRKLLSYLLPYTLLGAYVLNKEASREIPLIYGPRRFIIAFKSARNLYLS
jgi:hypothetical protein